MCFMEIMILFNSTIKKLETKIIQLTFTYIIIYPTNGGKKKLK